jgi:hypothetical protein
MDESEVIRERLLALRDPAPPGGAEPLAMVVKVVNDGSLVAQPMHYFDCVAVDIPGDPAEGAAVVFSALKGSFPVAFLHQAPNVGDVTLAERTSGVWVAVQPGSATSPPPPPPPPSPCTVTIGTGGCRIDEYTQTMPGGCEPARFPLNGNNWYIGATIKVTGPNGFSVSKPAPDGDHFDLHYATFTIPGDLCASTLTATVSASGYQTNSGTFIPTNVINSGDPFYVFMAPNTTLYFMVVSKCGDRAPCDVQDRSGATVDISGFGAGTTDKNGCVYITGTCPPWGSSGLTYTMTVAFPGAPYYETMTGTISNIGGCTNNTGGFSSFNPATISPEPTAAGLPLKPGYGCYASAYKGDCTGFDANFEIINTLAYKERPYPTTLHATINGIACTLTDNGGGCFTGQVTIHGLCWFVALPAGVNCGAFGGLYPLDTFGIYLHTYIQLGGPPFYPGPIVPWVAANCRVAGSIGNTGLYPWECGCDPGDSIATPQDVLTPVIFIALLDTDGPGSLPLNAQSTGVVINMPGYAGNPITGDAQVTE